MDQKRHGWRRPGTSHAYERIRLYARIHSYERIFHIISRKIRSYERISLISLKGRRQIRTGGILFYFLLVESDRQVLTRAFEHFTRAL